jgi:hypothetical protein
VTICVAAIASKPVFPTIVAATDKMLTAGDVTYEAKEGKRHFLSFKSIALGAGDSADEHEICARTFQKAFAAGLEGVTGIAQLFAETYRDYRREVYEREMLAPYGLTFESFNAQQRTLAPEFVTRTQSLLRGTLLPISGREFGCSTIVAGLDEAEAQGGGKTYEAHLYVIRDPGQVTCEDTAGFAAVGSGARHAESFLMLDGYSPDRGFAHAILSVYSAKRQAERAPFVGSETELLRLDMGGIGQAKPDDLSGIERIYQRNLKSTRRAGVKAVEHMNAFMEGLNAKTSQGQVAEISAIPNGVHQGA